MSGYWSRRRRTRRRPRSVWMFDGAGLVKIPWPRYAADRRIDADLRRRGRRASRRQRKAAQR